MKNTQGKANAFKKAIGMIAALFLVSTLIGPVTAADPIDPYKHVWLEMTNGARFADLSSGGANQSYYFKFDGGGLNAMHISNSSDLPFGQVTTDAPTSGTFYITDTGGRGFNDDIILMVAVQDPLPSGLNIHINASGYRWEPTAVLNEIPDEEDLTYYAGSVDEDFTVDNFTLYGTQDWKPCSSEYYPLFVDLEPDTVYYLAFIDLKVGNLGLNSTTGYSESLIDKGSVNVTYEITGTNGENIAFNAYGWCNQSNQGKGVSWTNALTGTGASAWEVNN
ncbi:hypothetical protein J2741_000694 [Methanolinea mesophila]|uniref:nitroreductase n=1 Tax=Methanolinea mesophila TaxID=547055 RepID=UPI001AE130CF|nr:nitroreductase [Methanolinea mesophila]MBP1928147.1 hypothetical protein [Methanolinea mesophila]